METMTLRDRLAPTLNAFGDRVNAMSRTNAARDASVPVDLYHRELVAWLRRQVGRPGFEMSSGPDARYVDLSDAGEVALYRDLQKFRGRPGMEM